MRKLRNEGDDAEKETYEHLLQKRSEISKEEDKRANLTLKRQ